MKTSVRLQELARLAEAEISGDPQTLIRGLASLDTAGPEEISFLAPRGDRSLFDNSEAGAVIVAMDVSHPDKNLLRVVDPFLAAARIHAYFLDTPFAAAGLHPQTSVGLDCSIPAAVTVGPMAVLGDRVRLGSRVFIGAGCVIGDDVVIGDDCHLHARVTVAHGSILGQRVIVHSGTVIGSDGFGYATAPDGSHVKRPQVGVVHIEDDVELGANVCIDRATFGVTRIGRGSKIDNLVQIAHNVEIGPHCLLVAQVGIAGSTILGGNVVLGGQAGLSGHIRLGDRVMVAAQAGVHNNLEAGTVVSGTPAMPHRKFMRVAAAMARLPDMVAELRDLRRLKELFLQEKNVTIPGEKT